MDNVVYSDHLDERHEKVLALRQKIIDECEKELARIVYSISSSTVKDVFDSLDLVDEVVPNDVLDEKLRGRIHRCTLLLALIDYAKYEYSFEHVIRSCDEYTIFQVSEHTIELMLQKDWDVSFHWLFKFQEDKDAYIIGEALTDKFFEFEFINIFDSIMFDKKKGESDEKEKVRPDADTDAKSDENATSKGELQS